MNKQWSTLDAFKAGFLKYNGHEPTLEVKRENKVVFMFEDSEKIQSLLKAYDTEGEPVLLGPYVRAVKAIKSAMHTYLMEVRGSGKNRRT